MAYEFKLPDLGEGLTEGEIARWLVAEGQELAEDDPLVEIATDKTTVEIPSPAAGTVTRILVAEGEVVPVGTVLVVIGGDGTEPRQRRPPRRLRRPSPRRRKLQFVGRKLACRRLRSSAASPRSWASIWRQLSGTGPNGRITEDDVRNAGGGLASDRDTSPRRDAASPYAACGGRSSST